MSLIKCAVCDLSVWVLPNGAVHIGQPAQKAPMSSPLDHISGALATGSLAARLQETDLGPEGWRFLWFFFIIFVTGHIFPLALTSKMHNTLFYT